MSPPVFFGYSAQRNIVPKRGRSKFPSRGNCTSRTNALYLFSIHLSRNCQATASFSAIVHEPRLQNLSKKSIKSLLSETLFHRMRFQICPPLHAFRGMEMDAVGGQFFSQAIVLHGHGLRHIQIQVFAQCVYASASRRWTSPPLSPGCLGKHRFHRGAHCVKVGSLLCVFYLLDGIRPEKSIQYGAVDKVSQQPSRYVIMRKTT